MRVIERSWLAASLADWLAGCCSTAYLTPERSYRTPSSVVVPYRTTVMMMVVTSIAVQANNKRGRRGSLSVSPWRESPANWTI
uniref:Putative secreted protein n=1 Tax=Anopheles marajoara TaxID=58244 RepID=A0A2M4CB39_9DIPT